MLRPIHLELTLFEKTLIRLCFLLMPLTVVGLALA